MRMKLAWLSNTRSDLQFQISQLVQVTEKRFSIDAAAQVKRLNTALWYAYNNIAHQPFANLKLRSIPIVRYSDANLTNIYDATYQLGRIVLLVDDENHCILVSFKRYKSSRVTRSVFSAEVIFFANLFDDTFAFRAQLEHLLRRSVAMPLLNIPKSLFDVIIKGSRASKKRIMLDIHATRTAYINREISNTGFVRTYPNLADGSTKPKMQRSLIELLMKGGHNESCEQWIFRAWTRRTWDRKKIKLGTEERKQTTIEVIQNESYLPRGTETGRMDEFIQLQHLHQLKEGRSTILVLKFAGLIL